MANGGNTAMKAKALKSAGLHSRGEIQGGMYRSMYDQGHNAWRNGDRLSYWWPPAKQQGWKSARDDEMRFFCQTGSDGSYHRLKAQGVSDEALDAMLASEVA